MGSMLSSVVPESDIEGYHILHVQKDSPAKEAGLEAFFDFVVALSGIVLIGNHELFLDLLQKNKNNKVDLKVYSVRTNKFRHVPITPTTNWSGKGLLGLTINFCVVKEALNNIHHVLEVLRNSPAEFAGLKSFSDYIYGVESNKENENIDFMTLVKGYDRKELKIFVYNINDDACRSLTIKPDSLWGGEGALGCGIGTGYLHRIPTPTGPDRTNTQSMMYGHSLSHADQSVKSYNLKFSQSTTAFNEGPASDESTCTLDIEEEVEANNLEKPSSSSSPRALTEMAETIA